MKLGLNWINGKIHLISFVWFTLRKSNIKGVLDLNLSFYVAHFSLFSRNTLKRDWALPGGIRSNSCRCDLRLRRKKRLTPRTVYKPLGAELRFIPCKHSAGIRIPSTESWQGQDQLCRNWYSIVIIIYIKDWTSLILSVSRVTTVLANVSSVFQLFSFLVVCSDMISTGTGFVAFFVSVSSHLMT